MEGYFWFKGLFVGTTFETEDRWYMCLKLRSERILDGLWRLWEGNRNTGQFSLHSYQRQVMGMAEVKDTTEWNCPMSSQWMRPGWRQWSAVLRIWHWLVPKRSLELGATWLFFLFPHKLIFLSIFGCAGSLLLHGPCSRWEQELLSGFRCAGFSLRLLCCGA